MSDRDGGTRRAYDLVDLIRQHGVARIATAVHNPGTQVGEGWDLTGWRILQTGGAVLFLQVEPVQVEAVDGLVTRWLVTGDTRVVCINAPERERARWETIYRDSDADAPGIVVMAPGDQVDPATPPDALRCVIVPHRLAQVAQVAQSGQP